MLSIYWQYIPRYINRDDREWNAGDQCLLRTTGGIWTVNVVLSNGLPRFSAGWNKFARDIKLKLDDIVHFTMLGNDQGKCLFDVVIQSKN